jgi:hypothetical protein
MVPLADIQSANKKWDANKTWTRFASYWTDSAHAGLTRRSDYPYILDTQIELTEHVLAFTKNAQEILVPKCYADMYQRIKLGLKLDEIIDGSDGTIVRPHLSNQQGVLITGQPGTGMLSVQFLFHSTDRSAGKSVSLWYLLIRLLQDYPKEPLLFIQPDLSLLFYRGCGFTSSDVSSVSDLPNKSILSCRGSLNRSSPSCLTLVEWPKEQVTQMLLNNTLTNIFASSPKETRLREFEKGKNPYVWGMPTWNMKELRLG